jgi:YhcH/YjgK/YiaL family protein
MIIDVLSNIEAYKLINQGIYDGLKFIQAASPDIALGAYPISEKAKALVMEYDTKDVDNGFGYEAHKHVIDVQCCMVNRERIPWCPLKNLEAYTNYDPVKDVTFYKWQDPLGEAIIGNNIFAVFFPEDGHAPVFTPLGSNPGYIKKIVIKVSI